MYKKIFLFATMFILLFMFSSCGNIQNNEASSASGTETSPSSPIPEEVVLPAEAEYDLYEVFFDDFGVAKQYRKSLRSALDSDSPLNSLLDDIFANTEWEYLRYTIFSGSASTAAAHYMNIALLYNADEYIEHYDLSKALNWYCHAADSGNSLGAIYAGDILLADEDVPADETRAFQLYQSAYNLSQNGDACERLGDCYFYGWGTEKDMEKARLMYQKGALLFNGPCMLWLSENDEADNPSFLKAALSLNDNCYDYWSIAYGTPGTLPVDNKSDKLFAALTTFWLNGEDPAAISIQASRSSSKWFTDEEISLFKQIAYSYSFYSFTAQHALSPNSDSFDVVFAERDDEWFDPDSAGFGMGKGYYIYDLDDDGQNELFASYHSGSGGPFNGYPLIILESDDEQLYGNPQAYHQYRFRDAVFLIDLSDTYYFAANSLSLTGFQSFDFDVVRYLPDREFHSAHFRPGDYLAESLFLLPDEGFNLHNGEKMAEILRPQVLEAITHTRNAALYSPEDSVRIMTAGEEENFLNDSHNYIPADINNDGTPEYLSRDYVELGLGKYEFIIHSFNIYQQEPAHTISYTELIDALPNYYGNMHMGNIYELLPLEAGIEQIWLNVIDAKTYTLVLTRENTTYALYVYYIEEDETLPVYQEFYMDIPYSIDVTFDER